MDADPDLDVVSGRTVYGMDSATLRVATLLDRGYIERRHGGRFTHVSNNGALYRRHVLERYPFPDEANPFVSAELRHVAMRSGNVKIGVEKSPRTAGWSCCGGTSARSTWLGVCASHVPASEATTVAAASGYCSWRSSTSGLAAWSTCAISDRIP
jgi:hypothetical protein